MIANKLFFLVLVIFLIRSVFSQDSEILKLSVVHFNDFHARFEETNAAGGSCKTGSTCMGGFARLYHQIMSMKNDTPDSILLNAGDTFQGTIWYTVGKWNVSQQFINTLPIDAEVLGNHDFDDGVSGVVPYIKALNHSIVVSNIDDSLEPTIQNLYTKSIVIERGGKKIGIIGVITSETATIASSGKLVFAKESPSVNEEADRLVKEEGVFSIIVLSHCGYDVDKQIAANASERISLIVGAHSHTFLYTGDKPPGPDKPAGPYPTNVKSKYGHNVLVVQASAYCKYLGNITIYLDKNGELYDYSGAPIFLDSSIPQDPLITEMMAPWKKLIDVQAEVVLGSSLVTLSKKGCYTKECTLGNFVSDAFVFYYTKNPPAGSWTAAPIGIINAGGLRTDIGFGNITYGDMVTSQPFGNTVDIGDIQGKYLKEMFEFTTEEYYVGRVYSSLSLIQLSGLRVVYNLNKPYGEQIESILVRCQNCTIPVYEPLEMDKYYKIALPSFLSSGGDRLVMLKNNLKNLVIGPVDVEAYQYYIEHRSPLIQEEEERIVIHGSERIILRNEDS